MVAPCTDDDILIEVNTCVYIFPETLWIFGYANSLKVYIVFPEALLILETPIHRKPLFVYIFSLRPLDFGDANSSKALVNKGTLYSLKL